MIVQQVGSKMIGREVIRFFPESVAECTSISKPFIPVSAADH